MTSIQNINSRLERTEKRLDSHILEDKTQFSSISNTLMDIKENHLSHIQNDMWWIKYLVLGLTSGIGAIIIGVLINFFTK